MSRCLLVVRVSTETQQLDDQRREIIEFAREKGFKDEDMILVEALGASAVKLDPKYMDMANSVKDMIISDRTINTVFVWEMSRLGRNEVILMDFKEFFIKNHIQFICKNPYLYLLNPDGTVNGGTELAFSLFATMSVQEVRNKQERFHRAKTAMRKQGKFIGGRCTKFGYKVGDGGYIVIDESTAPLVRLIFEMYSTGKWSIRTLYDELRERGYEINYHLINRMVADRTYIDGPYPPMISQELWDKCESVRNSNYLFIPKGKKYCFGSGIFRCYSCGRGLVAEGDQYRCWHHNKYSAPPHCKNGITVRIENLDGLLWWIASKEEIKSRMKMDADTKREYEHQVEILKEKVSAAQKRLDSLDEKRGRITELYVEGMISKEELKIRQNKTTLEAKTYKDTILSLGEKIEALLGVLLANEKEVLSEEKLESLYSGVFKEKNLKMMQEIVKKHIKKVTAHPIWFGRNRDRRAEKENAMLMTVELTLGSVQEYIYIPRKYKGHYFYFHKTDGREIPILDIRQIIREKEEMKEPRAFKKLKDW